MGTSPRPRRVYEVLILEPGRCFFETPEICDKSLVVALHDRLEYSFSVHLLQAQYEFLGSQGHSLVFEDLRSPEGWVQEDLDEAAELLLAYVLEYLLHTLEQILLHEVIVLEAVYVAEVAQVLEVGDRELAHVFEGAGLSEHEDRAIGQFPSFFCSAESVIHATTTTFQLRSQRPAAV